MVPSKKKQSKYLTALIRNYVNVIGSKIPSTTENYVQKFNSAPTNRDKAKLLLDIKGHQWFLQCFHKETCDKLLEELETDQPWKQSYDSYSSFEDLFEIIRSRYERKYVKQLVIYDISIHIAIIKGETKLLPKDWVYIHAKPLKNYKSLREQKKELPKLQKEGKLPYSQLAPFFPGLDARMIEDFLCLMNKLKPCGVNNKIKDCRS